MHAINVDDVALIFEGGGTRAANTAGVVNALLDNDIYFKDVFGISAGSSHTVNYISRDTVRARASFVEFMGLPEAAGASHFLRGQGFFNADYIYQRAGLEDGPLPFDFEAFMASPSQMHIDGYEVDTDSTVRWTKDDISTLTDLMNRVQASSSMPFVMPPTRFDGHMYYDGGLGDSWGIALDAAIDCGYNRFFVVCTQEKGFRKTEPSHPWMSYVATFPHRRVAERTNERWKHYNALYDRLDALEESGQALVYHPKEMPIDNTCRDVEILRDLYEKGYIQAHQELHKWKYFLGL